MLLDHIFTPTGPIEMTIIRKDGKIMHVARPLPQTTDKIWYYGIRKMIGGAVKQNIRYACKRFRRSLP